MSQDIARLATEVNSEEEEVIVTAWSGAPEGGYQFTTVGEDIHYFSLSGKQIEYLHHLHLLRKEVGLERMNTTGKMMVTDYDGNLIHGSEKEF